VRLPSLSYKPAWGLSGHEWHELGGHGDEGAHHVAVFVFEDVAVVHVAAAVGGEADVARPRRPGLAELARSAPSRKGALMLPVRTLVRHGRPKARPPRRAPYG
jgi:hypothetical protein